MMKLNMSSRLFMAAIVLLIVMASAAHAAVFMTFTVTTNADAVVPPPGSLRAAITNSNANPPPLGDHNLIVFAIPGAGVHVITVVTALPAVLVPTEIDATTQPGFVPNTALNSDNEVPQIVLTDVVPVLTGIFITAGNSSVEGMVINNFAQGITIIGGGNNVIRANFIGTNANATSAVPNQFGIHIASSSLNTIGGDKKSDRNIISGNSLFDVILDLGADANGVFNNFIGLSASGNSALGVTPTGIGITAADNQIGESGIDVGEVFHPGNVISGHTVAGILIAGPTSTGNEVEVNKIGTNAAGTTAIPNFDGVSITTGASNNEIGEGNLIAFNTHDGVIVSGPTTIDNTITQNSITGNLNEGIELALGANELIPAPVLVSAEHLCKGVGTDICGAFTDVLEPNTTFTIEFFSNDVCGPPTTPVPSGQGKTFIGSITVTTNAVGVATFDAVLPVDVPSGKFITATATEADGSTSEFSNCAVIEPKADLSITKSVCPTEVQSGDAVLFVLKVKNLGPETAQNVVVTDNVPNSTFVIACFASSGGSCTNIGNAVTANFASIPSGATREVVILAFVRPGIVGAVNDTACVTGDVLDCNPNNNCSTVCLKVDPCTERGILCTNLMSGPLGVTPGQTGTWTYRVTLLACQSDMVNVRLIGQSTGCRIAPPSLGTASVSGSSVVWSIPKILKGQTATLDVTVNTTIPKTCPRDTFWQLSAPWAIGFSGGSCSPSNPVCVKVLGQ